MRARDYRRLNELETGLGWPLTEIPDRLRPKCDWSRGGKPLVGQVNRAFGWFITTGALVDCPVLLWDAVTRDWTMVFAALVIAAGAFAYRLGLRKAYGATP